MNKEKKTKSCFWGHKWGKWEQYTAIMIARKDLQTTYNLLRQRRYCLRCNKIQIEDI